MGRWKGASFKEYINEDLTCYSMAMLKDMKRSFGFVNIASEATKDVLVDVTNTTMVTYCNTWSLAAA